MDVHFVTMPNKMKNTITRSLFRLSRQRTLYCVLCTYCKYCTYLNTLKSLQCSDGPAATPAAVVPTEQLEQDPVEQPEQHPVDEENIIDAQAEVEEAIVMQQAAIEVPPEQDPVEPTVPATKPTAAGRGLLSVAARLGQAAAGVGSPRNVLDTVVNAMATPRAPVPIGPAATPVEQDPVETTGPAAMPAAAVPTLQLDQHDGDALCVALPADTNARDTVRPLELIATNPPQDEAGRGPLSSPRLRSAVAQLGQVAAGVGSPMNILDSGVDTITPRTSTSMQSTRRDSTRRNKGRIVKYWA